MDEPYFDEETGYWVGPEIKLDIPPIWLKLPDPTPDAGWPPDDE